MSTVKQINARSLFLGRASVKLEKAIHEHAVVISDHINEHGDVTLADTLVNALGKSIRANALKQWFLDFGGCSWNDEKKKFGKAKDFAYDRDTALLNPFYDWTPEPAFKPVDSMALINAVIKKLESAADDTSENGAKHKINLDHLAALKAIAEGATISVQ